ncbi:MAG TPA: hypothetical protein VK616_20795 [Flavitalea sp.]|nr:hypothetical protein [Flavitalea sp.]
MHPVFMDDYSKVNKKGMLFVEQPDEFFFDLRSCTMPEALYEHFAEFVRFIVTIKHKPTEK